MYYCSGMNYEALPKEVLQEVLLLEQQHKRLETREVAQTKFLAYAKHVYEGLLRVDIIVLLPKSSRTLHRVT